MNQEVVSTVDDSKRKPGLPKSLQDGGLGKLYEEFEATDIIDLMFKMQAKERESKKAYWQKD